MKNNIEKRMAEKSSFFSVFMRKYKMIYFSEKSYVKILT